MKLTHLNRALLASAALLLVTTSAYAQSTNATPPGKGNAADPAKTAVVAPGEKAKDKLDDAKNKVEAKGKDLGDRAARKAKQLEEEKTKLRASLRGPMDDSAKQELRRHAERVARLERIKSLAETAKDTEAVDRSSKLLAKENARHDKWMEKHVATATAAAPAQPSTKEGAK